MHPLVCLGHFRRFPRWGFESLRSHRFSCRLPATERLKESICYYFLHCMFIQAMPKTFWRDINWMKMTAIIKLQSSIYHRKGKHTETWKYNSHNNYRNMRPYTLTGPVRLVVRCRCSNKPVSFHFSRSEKGNSL